MGGDEKEALVKDVISKVVANLTPAEAHHVLSSMGAESHKKHTDNGWVDYQELEFDDVVVKYYPAEKKVM